MNNRMRFVDNAWKDAAWMDSSLAYFINQLDKLDPKLYLPLTGVSWDRDIKLRSDITFANEASSFIKEDIASIGSQAAQGKPWITQNDSDLIGVDIDGAKITTPIRLLGREIRYTSVEMEKYALASGGRSLDTTKFNALNLLYQLNTDECVYIGDPALGFTGLVNNTNVTSALVDDDGTGDEEAWTLKTADQIVRDVDKLLTLSWNATGNTVCPSELRLPPTQFAYINSKKLDTGSGLSILEYINKSNLCLSVNGKPLNIKPLKWLDAAGADDTQRMMAYTNREDFVRFPMVPVRREMTYHKGITFHAPYIWAYGEVEFVKTVTVRYADGI
jgi:hypothetical protein